MSAVTILRGIEQEICNVGLLMDPKENACGIGIVGTEIEVCGVPDPCKVRDFLLGDFAIMELLREETRRLAPAVEGGEGGKMIDEMKGLKFTPDN